MAPLQLLFIRHGETDDNITRTLQGWRDTSLTPLGHKQASILAGKFLAEYPATSISTVYHSPLLRIRQTIAPLLEQLNSSSVQVISDADLRGQGLGALEGGSYDSIDMSNPRSADGQDGVETFDDFVERLRRCLGRIIGSAVARLRAGGSSSSGGAGAKNVVVVATHGVGITSLFKMLEGSLRPVADGLEWRRVASRGDGAYEVRWTDSDDVARLSVEAWEDLPVTGGEGKEVLDWSGIKGELFVIEVWGKKEKAL